MLSNRPSGISRMHMQQEGHYNYVNSKPNANYGGNKHSHQFSTRNGMHAASWDWEKIINVGLSLGGNTMCYSSL